MVTCATADKPHLARRFCAVVLRYAPETFQLKADFPLMSGNVLRYRSSVVYNSTFSSGTFIGQTQCSVDISDCNERTTSEYPELRRRELSLTFCRH